MRHLASRIVSFTVVVFAGSALAVDGVIEISHAAAIIGGVTPGDTAGYPITISQRGSYRLTGNLTVPANTTAISIAASGVNIDLGGFDVRGPNACSGVPATSCTIEGGAPGIHAPTANEFLASVRNGTVVGMAGPCIDLQGDSSRVEDISVYFCGSSGAAGIRVGDYGVVSESTSLLNLGDGISFGNGGAAHHNESRGNRLAGIRGGGAYGGSITGNRAFDNGTDAILGLPYPTPGARTLASKNVTVGTLRSVSAGDNICNGVLC